ncbi:MAG: DUF368 domain-containing protein [Trueperaceae bacterium]|nr:DUF368 domain-containing protein [Trueperaceae bacterium]
MPRSSPPDARRPRRAALATAARGLGIGAADLVPGVSGGTMALILGIYPRLIGALAAFTAAPFRAAVRRGHLAAAWRAVDGGFLAALAAGMAVAIVGLAGALSFALARYEVAVYGAFFGLIAASAPLVFRRVARPGPRVWGAAALGAAVAWSLAGLVPMEAPGGPLVLAASGAAAVSALLLPGVSGAFVLLLLGQYERVLNAVATLDPGVLVPLALGMIAGGLAAARGLAWVLTRYPDPTLGLLAGFLVGALRKVWPWQGDGLVVPLAAPASLADAALGVTFLALGVAAVVMLEASAGPRSRDVGSAPPPRG